PRSQRERQRRSDELSFNRPAREDFYRTEVGICYMRDATRVVRAGVPEAAQGQSFRVGPAFAAPFHVKGDPASSPYTYARFHNPTWTAYEQAITELEKAAATLVFSSGMAAVTATLGAIL